MKNRYVEVFIACIFLFLFIIYFLDFFSLNEYIIVRNPIQYKEAFTDLNSADLNSSYSLLEDVLPLKDKQASANINSQSCYDNSFNSRLELTGNYLQRTNNYTRKDPESCTTPNQDFVNAYYKLDPLA